MSDEKRSFDFPSRAKPDVRYRWYRRYYDAEFDTFRRDLAVDTCGQYDTCGDGDVQHSPVYSVNPADFPDLMLSMAVHLHSCPMDAEVVARNWPDELDRRHVLFYAGLRPHDSGKPQRYYNPSDHKVSTADAKRHDKRWHKVPSWADGSVDTVVRLLMNGSDGEMIARPVLWRYAVCDMVRDIMAEAGLGWGTHPSTYCKLTGEYEAPDHVTDNAYSYCKLTVRAARQADHADNVWRCLAHNAALTAPVPA